MSSAPRLRRATDEDLPAIAELDGRAFHDAWTPARLEAVRPTLDPGRFLVAVDEDGALVGTTGSYPLVVTVPGGAQLAVPGVTWVAVALHARRRGVLRALLAEQHRAEAAGGAPLAVLTASEGGIYGRFGYGAATTEQALAVDRRLARVRQDAPGATVPARHASAAAVREHAGAVHERWRARVPGAVSRTPAWWDVVLGDHPDLRAGAAPLVHLTHPDGYASYRVAEGRDEVRVQDLFAATDEAHAALWRALLSLDLATTVSARRRPPDEVLPQLLQDARQVRTTGSRDGLWVRLLDVPAALSARRYAAEVDAVVEVDDPFLGLGGRFRLWGGPDGAECAPTSDAADVRLGVAALGSAYLGGRRLGQLARAGLVAAEGERGARALARLGVALLADREPEHGTPF